MQFVKSSEENFTDYPDTECLDSQQSKQVGTVSYLQIPSFSFSYGFIKMFFYRKEERS